MSARPAVALGALSGRPLPPSPQPHSRQPHSPQSHSPHPPSPQPRSRQPQRRPSRRAGGRSWLPRIARATTALAAASLVTAGLSAIDTAEAADSGSSRRTVSAPLIGNGVVLFIDSSHISRITGASRTWIQGRKVQVDGRPTGQVVVTQRRDDGPNRAVGVSTVTTDRVTQGGVTRTIYRMWLRSDRNTIYRESTDGLRWYVNRAAPQFIAPSVVDANVVRDSVNGKYYLLGYDPAAKDYVEMVSSDGWHFARTASFVGPLADQHGDVINATYDTVGKRLLAYAKQKTEAGVVCSRSPVTRSGGRTFGLNVSNSATSARLYRPQGMKVMADCADELAVPPVSSTPRPAHLYGLPFQRYGEQFVAFPWFFRVTFQPQGSELSGQTDGPIDSQIAATRDPVTTRWTRPPAFVRRTYVTTNTRADGSTYTVKSTRIGRPTLIPRGPEGSWDDGMLYAQSGITTIGSNSLIYYTGWDDEHTPSTGRRARVGAAIWTKDRFVGVTAKPRMRATLATRNFKVPASGRARDLRVNAMVPTGALRAAVIDARTGRAIRGFTADRSVALHGNHIDDVVRWRGHRIGELAGRPIRVLFTWPKGSMYSFSVR